jgi:hypothetical protein
MKVVWYDGGKRPASELAGGMIREGNGVILIGDKDTLVTSYEGGGRLLSGTPTDHFKSAPELFAKHADWEQGHYDEWIAACKGGPKAPSNFDIAGYLTEIILLGCIALRVGEGVRMEWDGPGMKSPNCPEAAQFVKRTNREGW